MNSPMTMTDITSNAGATAINSFGSFQNRSKADLIMS